MTPVPERVVVYGVTGSGKSTLAARIAERTGLPYVSADDLSWQPGWVPVPDEEQRRRIAEVCAGERWVLDAAYGKWRDVVLARTQLVVGLDYPRWLSLSRLVRRTLWRSVTRERICNGNVESFRQMFSADSIIRWHFTSFAAKRARIRAWAAESPGPVVVRHTSPRETRRWLENL
ncbi:P-loop NTPase family protein [Amycolatopsis eburnea]|uniref:Adenylate kinase n=1 Tax=Amycolatopsis eburnea TaxID=2267691 RepID=A0A3R9DWP2_9PSEU|nr:adenylate kinase [Amycolatopsis eburnea]RSD13699.1 adenylate kinase [Amycolatopsis eburnea]